MCEYINQNNSKCSGKNKYGNYCYKHRSCFLCDKDLIILDNFTNKESDYKVNQLKKTLSKNKISFNNSQKKNELFNLYKNFALKLNDYDIKKLIKIQQLIKKRHNQINSNLRGPGFLNRKLCNNNEDFFTYDDKETIEDDYFISLKDNNNLVWFFDIRSINKLLEHDNKNPYTREKFPNEFLERAKIITEKLKNKNLKLNYNADIVKERKENIKQITVDLFSEIEISGYECNINWFLELNTSRLKRLYRILEDIWNYRAQLPQSTKNNIVPPNGVVFNIPLHQIDRMHRRNDLQKIIINDVSKFKNAVTHGDKTLGFMYFLMGLGHVSPGCYNSYPWLITG